MEEKSLEAINRERLERLEGAAERTDEREAQDLAEQLSIRDRLMRRVKTKTFTTVFTDDLGDFPVETRLMTSGERYRAVQYNMLLAKASEDFDKYSEAIQGFRDLVKDLVVTEGLDAEFWDGDYVSDDVVIALVMNTLFESVAAVGESIGSFRQR